MQAAWNIPGWRNKLWTFLKGPGWQPGKPRLGNISDIPDVRKQGMKRAIRKGVSWRTDTEGRMGKEGIGESGEGMNTEDSVREAGLLREV